MHKFLVDSNETKLIGFELSEVNGSKVIRSEVNRNLFSPKKNGVSSYIWALSRMSFF